MDVYPRLLEQDVSFYGHEFPEYWNDVGSLEEYRQGNFDALTGALEVDLAGTTPAEGVLLGPGCEVGNGAELQGPVVVGGDCRIGEGSLLRESVVLPGVIIPAATSVVGAIVAPRTNHA